jgi:hypothetical protein
MLIFNINNEIAYKIETQGVISELRVVNASPKGPKKL